jgi:ABC-type transport system involved in multi-copper enzyme maturation permease subunit
MINLFRAEWQKISGNRWVVGFLIWVFPAAIAALVVLATLYALFGTPEGKRAFGLLSDTPIQWTHQMINVWNIPNEFFGRFILIAFAAVVFAGEYQWGTWKNLLPRRQRVPLILTKFVALGAFVVVAFGAASLILGVGWGIPVRIAGSEYGPPLSGAVLSEFLSDYLVQAATAFTATLIAASYAALAAMVTRSILASMMVGSGIMLVEMVSPGLFSLLGVLVGRPELAALYQLMPSYNLSNVASWASWGQPTFFQLEYAEPNSLGLSLLILVIWVVGLVGLTTYLFQRQDVTS